MIRLQPAGARIAVASMTVAIALVAALQGTSQAAPPPRPAPPTSILPTNIGAGIPSHQAVSLKFASPMDRASVERDLLLVPREATALRWRADRRGLAISPRVRWHTDRRYLLVLPASTRLADGSSLGTPLLFSFTTQTAPAVTRFEVSALVASDTTDRAALLQSAPDAQAAPPADTAEGTSARTSIRIGFSAAMDRAGVERAFVLTPGLAGTFAWDGDLLVFTPTDRLRPGVRYALTLLGALDLDGNPLGGDATFSFTTATAAQVVKVHPVSGAQGVTDRVITVWFSGPMSTTAVAHAFRLYDITSRHGISGDMTWNTARTQMRFAVTALPAGHRLQIRLGPGTADADGNAVTGSFAFTTRSADVQAPRSAVAVASAGTSAAAYALAKINASRAAYGFGPLRLDPAISAVATAHAVDQIRYGYFSHTGRDGSDVKDRLNAAGIANSWASENQCETSRSSITAAIDWCHALMMGEPYPGYWNHIANILSTHFTRVGFGYASGGGRTVLTWDFAG